MADDRLLALARELEATDERLAAATADVRALDDEVASIGGRAAELERFLAGLPAARELAAAAAAEAEAERDRRRAEVEAAQRELVEAEETGKDERIAAARRGVVRTVDALASAERRLERADEARSDLERRAREVEAETPELLQQARGLAGRVAELPRVSPHVGDLAEGLAGVGEWTSRAHAALFVVRGALDTERERVVQEANALGASAFGEPMAATSVALVRRRLETAEQ